LEHEEKVRHTLLDGRLYRAVGRGSRVRMRGQDEHGKIDDAKQAKKQAEKQRQELESKLQEGQKNLEGQ
jgi:hypothetical protein